MNQNQLLIEVLRELEEKHVLSAKILTSARYAVESGDLKTTHDYVKKLRPIWEATYQKVAMKLMTHFPEILHWFGSPMDKLKRFTSMN